MLQHCWHINTNTITFDYCCVANLCCYGFIFMENWLICCYLIVATEFLRKLVKKLILVLMEEENVKIRGPSIEIITTSHQKVSKVWFN